MTATLNGLRRSYDAFEGGLRLWFMPYTTVYWRVVYDRLVADQPAEDWHYSKGAYAMTVGSIVDCEVLGDVAALNLDAQGFLHFWRNRTGDIVADYDLFAHSCSMNSMTDLQQGYTETRMIIPQAAKELQQERPDAETDPETLRAGGKRSRKKSPR
jgi:hypothetical protein